MAGDELAPLLSLISHELRSPLGVIRGYLKLLQQGQGLSDQQRHAVGAALTASGRAADLLTQVSSLAQLHQSDLPFERSRVALGELTQAAVDAVALPADRAVTLSVTELPTVNVLVDKALLATAMTSLMTAVVRAQPRDGTVSVSAAIRDRDQRPGVAVEISATDAAGDDRSERPLDIGRGGLGLELPLAAHLVSRHDGEILERRAGSRLAGMIVWLPTAT